MTGVLITLESNKAHLDWVLNEHYGIGKALISPDKKTLAVGADKVNLFDLTRK